MVLAFFAALPGMRYGSVIWIGVAARSGLLGDRPEWLAEPRLLQNDQGPKCADPRLFLTHEGVAAVGYTRVAPRSNTPGIADYYVRAFHLELQRCGAQQDDPLAAEDANKKASTNSIDGGVFPATSLGQLCPRFGRRAAPGAVRVRVPGR